MGEEKEGPPQPGGGKGRGGFKKRDLFLHFQLISVLTYDAPLPPSHLFPTLPAEALASETLWGNKPRSLGSSFGLRREGEMRASHEARNE